jgi:branched-chain amino acid transport system ATP-binding protein
MIDTVFDLIADLRRDGLTVLLVEQNVALALEIADRATVLANGEVVLAGTAKELAGSDLVRQAYLGA